MCLSSAPASFSNTTLFVGTSNRWGGLSHLVGYANSAEDYSGHANCMMLPFPSADDMTSANVIDTQRAEHCLADMAAAIPSRQLMTRGGGGDTFGSKSLGVQTFRLGIYTVLLGKVGARFIEALLQVPKEKRPVIGEDIIEFWERNYPGYHLAICCFNNRNRAESTPLLWHYRPANPEVLVAPAIDGHDGRAPVLGKKVYVDHTLVVGTTQHRGAQVRYRDRLSPEMRDILPTHVTGIRYSDEMLPNGDFLIDVSELSLSNGAELSERAIRRGVLQIA